MFDVIIIKLELFHVDNGITLDPAYEFGYIEHPATTSK